MASASLTDFTTLHAEYRARYPYRLFLERAFPVLLLLYFGLRIAANPEVNKESAPQTLRVLAVIVGVYVVAVVIANVMRMYQENAFSRDHPEFRTSVAPNLDRLLAILPFVVGGSIFTVGLLSGDSQVLLACFVLGFGIFVLSQALTRRALTSSRHEIPWDTELGQRIATVLESAGVQPKRLVIMRSMTPNAVALQDGIVVLTSSLQTLLTVDEVVAVVAHELSHVRDKDAKTLTNLRWALILPLGVAIGLAYEFGSSSRLEPLLIPIVVGGVSTIGMLPNYIRSCYSRRFEFKSDADTARLGLGPELISALTKITKFQGTSDRWIGMDKYFLTHPSLRDRVAAIDQLRVGIA
jgi:heat shock protein HtpX